MANKSEEDNQYTMTDSADNPSDSRPHSAENRRTRYRHQSVEKSSIVDGLLFEIYERWHYSHRDSFDSDTFTEYSSTEVFHGRHGSHLHWAERDDSRLSRSQLQNKDVSEIRNLMVDLHHRANQLSSQLIKQLKRRDRQKARLQKNSDVVTAILQAASQKRRVDANMKFSIQPFTTDGAFDQWCDAMKAVTRLPLGIPNEFRKKVWLALADSHMRRLQLDWESTVKFAFNERSNPDDDTLGLQIVKDLHRTGCSGFSGQDNDEDRAVLKRVLLGYARWNKQVGYCQGFNVLAALILDVVDRKEEDALKVMIFLIDHVLPENFFANNLRALSVDMAVFRDLLRLKLPKLSRHLDYLQTAARDNTTGANYEPPLTNVFTMQWFLTLFATCLPKHTVLRVWDSVFLEGSEILLRTALAIWGRLTKRILQVSSADEFYCMMGALTQEMLDDKIIHADSLIKTVYSMAPMPLPHLTELREKYTYNITPFSGAMNAGKKKSGMQRSIFSEEELDDDDLMNVTCFTGMIGQQVQQNSLKGAPDHLSSVADISDASPGAYAANTDQLQMGTTAVMERMSTDLTALRKQYQRLRERQKQAHIIIANANARHQSQPENISVAMPKMELPVVVNHLFMGKQGMGSRNKKVTPGPRIATVSPIVDTKYSVRSRSNSQSSQSLNTNTSLSYKEGSKTLDLENGFAEHACIRSDDEESEVTECSGMVSPISDRKSSIGSLKSSDSNEMDNGLEPGVNSIDDSKETTNEVLNNDKMCEITENTCEENVDGGEAWVPLCTVNKPMKLEEEKAEETTERNNNVKLRVNSAPETEGDQSLDLPQQKRPSSLLVSPRRASHSGASSTQKMDSRMAEYVAKLTYKAQKKTFKEHDETTGYLSPPISPSKSPSSPNSGKFFNPFPKSHISESRAKNGIRLGLYKPNPDGDKKSPIKGINRSHINSCLHRQYMTEVKGNRGSKW